MSWSSGASSAPGFRGAAGRRREGEGRSPVPYRENPMAYEPAVMCGCNPPRKAPRWISWSVQNPGRRYYACVDALNGTGCGFVEWHDDPLPKFFSDLLGDLRDAVWRQRGQGTVEVDGGGTQDRLRIVEDQLKEKTAELEAMKGKYDNLVFVFIVFVLGLVVGKIFMQ